LAILSGFLSRIAAGGLVVIFIGAVVVHLRDGWMMNWYGRKSGEGPEYFVMLLSPHRKVARRVGTAVRVLSDFQTPDVFNPPSLSAGGDTPIGAAIEAGLALLDQRKQAYRSNSISFYRPWVFLITDGGPTDYWQAAADKVKQGEAGNRFSFFAVGVEGARMDVLALITTREPLKLQELRFRDLFKWLSNSLSSVSQSKLGTQVALENPAAPGGWGSVG
jgi:uncharacterized protein YegL